MKYQEPYLDIIQLEYVNVICTSAEILQPGEEEEATDSPW